MSIIEKPLEKPLFFRLGQVLGVNGTLDDKVIVFARLKNPTYRAFERPYFVVNVNSLLYPVPSFETSLHALIKDNSVFNKAKDFYEINLKDAYLNLKKLIEELQAKVNQSNLDNKYEFELMSEQEFCSLY